MKQYKRILMLSMVLAGLVFLAGCSKKTPMSIEDFVSHMEKQGYIIDTLEMEEEVIKNENKIGSKSTLMDSETFHLVEFYVFDEEKVAIDEYKGWVRYFETMRGNVSSHSSINLLNFSRFAQKSNGCYFVASRIENTLVVVYAEDSMEKRVEEALKGTGY